MCFSFVCCFFLSTRTAAAWRIGDGNTIDSDRTSRIKIDRWQLGQQMATGRRGQLERRPVRVQWVNQIRNTTTTTTTTTTKATATTHGEQRRPFGRDRRRPLDVKRQFPKIVRACFFSLRVFVVWPSLIVGL